jgi:hypothetical protein
MFLLGFIIDLCLAVGSGIVAYLFSQSMVVAVLVGVVIFIIIGLIMLTKGAGADILDVGDFNGFD